MTKDDVIIECDLSDEEFDELYTVVIGEVRRHGTHGLSQMLAYVEQELNEGREVI